MGTKSCGSEERIDAYLLGRMSEEEARSFEEHYFNCAECFEEVSARQPIVEVIKSRGREIFGDSDEAAATAPPRAGKLIDALIPRRWVFVPLAAAALLALAALVFVVLPRHRPAPPHFVLDGEEVLRGETLSLVSPADELPAAPVSLEWKPLDNAADYKVSIYGDGLFWSTTTKDSVLPLPEDVRARLLPGGSYSWQVKAFSAQGQILAISTKQSFKLVVNN